MNFVLVSVIVLSLLASGMTTSFAAKPWDLLIRAQFEQDQISINEKPVIFGTVLDQVGRPVSGTQVRIIFADNSVTTNVTKDGSFRYEFGQQAMQGMFSVTISATAKDLKGFATTKLKVGEQTSTFEDLYYTKNFDKNTPNQNDPYKALKQKQYQKFIEEQNKRKQKLNDIEAKKYDLDEKRNIAIQKRRDAINATKVGPGIYSGYDYDRYIANVDPRAKDTISTQMEYTRQLYEEAQYEMKKVLDNGGSLQDARKAYFEKLVVTKDQVEKVGNSTENHSKIKKHDDSKINSKKVKGIKYNKNLK